METVLQQLLGAFSTSRFRADFYEKRPWVGQRAPELRLPSARDIEEYVACGLVSPGAIRLVRAGEQLPREMFTSASGRREAMRPARILSLYREGVSIVLDALHLRFAELAELSCALGDELEEVVGVNGYLTPAASGAFPRHYDTHDVFVVQLRGRKEWCVYPPIVQLPGPDRPARSGELANPREDAMQICLTPRDVLYLPRGWVHEAHTGQHASLHLTVGVMVRAWSDEIIDAVRAASQDNVELRRSSAHGAVAEALTLVAGHLTPEMRLARRAQRSVDAANPPVRWPYNEDTPLNSESVLRRASTIPLAVLREDGKACLNSPHVTIRLRGDLHETLSWMTTRSGSFRIAEIPGPLTDPERIRLASLVVEQALFAVE